MPKRRSPAQVARDRRVISNLYMKGWLQTDIAKELGISNATISRDLRTLYKQWERSSLVDIDSKKAEELAKIDHLEREYWDAWERSCKDAETIRQEGVAIDKVIEPKKITKTAAGQAGDPRFLTGVQWCIDRRCKIFGIDAPEKKDHKISNVKELTDAELLAIIES